MTIDQRIRQGENTVVRVERTANRVRQYAPQARTVMHQGGAGAPAPAAAAPPVAVEMGRAQTPYVEPGAQLQMDMIVSPAAALKADELPFTLLSRSLDQPDALSVVEQGCVTFKGATGFGNYWPFIAVAAGAFALIVLILVATRALG